MLEMFSYEQHLASFFSTVAQKTRLGRSPDRIWTYAGLEDLHGDQQVQKVWEPLGSGAARGRCDPAGHPDDLLLCCWRLLPLYSGVTAAGKS